MIVISSKSIWLHRKHSGQLSETKPCDELNVPEEAAQEVGALLHAQDLVEEEFLVGIGFDHGVAHQPATNKEESSLLKSYLVLTDHVADVLNQHNEKTN
jgi:hypothetical protein